MWISQEVRTAIAWTPVRCNSFLVIRSLGIDIIGPLKEVTAWGYKYILVATEYSKWAEVIPVRGPVGLHKPQSEPRLGQLHIA